MYVAVNETAKAISPLSIAISNGILRSIELMLKAIPSRSDDKKIRELAYSLKLEYPKESDDYVMNMAIDLYEAGRK